MLAKINNLGSTRSLYILCFSYFTTPSPLEVERRSSARALQSFRFLVLLSLSFPFDLRKSKQALERIKKRHDQNEGIKVCKVV